MRGAGGFRSPSANRPRRASATAARARSPRALRPSIGTGRSASAAPETDHFIDESLSLLLRPRPDRPADIAAFTGPVIAPAEAAEISGEDPRHPAAAHVVAPAARARAMCRLALHAYRMVRC